MFLLAGQRHFRFIPTGPVPVVKRFEYYTAHPTPPRFVPSYPPPTAADTMGRGVGWGSLIVFKPLNHRHGAGGDYSIVSPKVTLSNYGLAVNDWATSVR